MIRRLACVLLPALLAASVLTPSLSWLFPCIHVTRIEPCERTTVPSTCTFASCDWHPSTTDRIERGVAVASLLIMCGMVAASANARRARRNAAVSGAVAIAITLFLDRFLYGYGAVSVIEVLVSALPIGLGALLALIGGWIASTRLLSPTSPET